MYGKTPGVRSCIGIAKKSVHMKEMQRQTLYGQREKIIEELSNIGSWIRTHSMTTGLWKQKGTHGARRGFIGAPIIRIRTLGRSLLEHVVCVWGRGVAPVVLETKH